VLGPCRQPIRQRKTNTLTLWRKYAAAQLQERAVPEPDAHHVFFVPGRHVPKLNGELTIEGHDRDKSRLNMRLHIRRPADLQEGLGRQRQPPAAKASA